MERLRVMAGRTKDIFERAYEENFPLIYRYIFRLVGSQEESEQLTQETFMKYYTCLADHSYPRNSRALVFRIAHNVSLDHLRRLRKHKEVAREGFRHQNNPHPIDEEVISRQRRARIRNALNGLPPRDQKCLLLYQEGFSYAEIAEAAQVKRSSVGKVLARATERLAKAIKDGERK